MRVFPATLLQEASHTNEAATSKFSSTNDLDHQGHVDCAANLTWGQWHRQKRGHDPSWKTQGRLLWPRKFFNNNRGLYGWRKLLVIKPCKFFIQNFEPMTSYPLSIKSWCPSKIKTLYSRLWYTMYIFLKKTRKIIQTLFTTYTTTITYFLFLVPLWTFVFWYSAILLFDYY